MRNCYEVHFSKVTGCNSMVETFANKVGGLLPVNFHKK